MFKHLQDLWYQFVKNYLYQNILVLLPELQQDDVRLVGSDTLAQLFGFPLRDDVGGILENQVRHQET
jgi:hypothetical protein